MKKLSRNEMSTTTGGGRLTCALAIAGTIATTAGAAFITGGASLIVFLIQHLIHFLEQQLNPALHQIVCF